MDFSRVKPKKGEEEATAYETTWDSSDISETKRGVRLTVPIELEVTQARQLAHFLWTVTATDLSTPCCAL